MDLGPTRPVQMKPVSSVIGTEHSTSGCTTVGSYGSRAAQRRAFVVLKARQEARTGYEKPPPLPDIVPYWTNGQYILDKSPVVSPDESPFIQPDTESGDLAIQSICD